MGRLADSYRNIGNRLNYSVDGCCKVTHATIYLEHAVLEGVRILVVLLADFGEVVVVGKHRLLQESGHLCQALVHKSDCIVNLSDDVVDIADSL